MTARLFESLDWREITMLLGARTSRTFPLMTSVGLVLPSKRGDVASPPMTLIITDNCGEVNVVKVVKPLLASVPLPSVEFRQPNEAMAHRLHAAIYGYAIDYDFGREADDDEVCVDPKDGVR